MTDPTYTAAMAALLGDRALAPADAEALMDAVMRGDVADAQVAALLTALRLRPPGAALLAAFARAIRRHMVPVHATGPVLDTCGTGGSGLDTANTSTMAAFVVAAAGVRVAKHGNRSSSGRCGSADLLEAAGVQLVQAPERSAAILEEVGLAFLYAPAHHPAFRHVGPTRKALGFRTVFNQLGPLCNPAGATRQLLGVSDPTHARTLAAALAALGSTDVLVVHGEDGLDEASTAAATRTWRVREGAVEEGRLTPEAVGLQRTTHAALRGGGVADNLRIFEAVLSGQPGPHADLVALNAGLALVVAGAAETPAAGVDQARALLATGAAKARFERLRAASRGAP